MGVKTATGPKAPADAARTTKHGCCGAETAVESQPDAVTTAGHDHCGPVAAPKTAGSSCCCGGGNEKRPSGS